MGVSFFHCWLSGDNSKDTAVSHNSSAEVDLSVLMLQPATFRTSTSSDVVSVLVFESSCSTVVVMVSSSRSVEFACWVLGYVDGDFLDDPWPKPKYDKEIHIE